MLVEFYILIVIITMKETYCVCALYSVYDIINGCGLKNKACCESLPKKIVLVIHFILHVMKFILSCL